MAIPYPDYQPNLNNAKQLREIARQNYIDSKTFLSELNKEIKGYENKLNFELNESSLILSIHEKIFKLLNTIHEDVDQIHKDLRTEADTAKDIYLLFNNLRTINRLQQIDTLNEIGLAVKVHQTNLNKYKSDIDKIKTDIARFKASVSDKKIKDQAKKNELNKFFYANTKSLFDNAENIHKALNKNNEKITNNIKQIEAGYSGSAVIPIGAP